MRYGIMYGLYQSLACEVALCSAMLLWSDGTSHKTRGWKRHEAVMALVSVIASGCNDWAASQLADASAYLELPLDVTARKSGLPLAGQPATPRHLEGHTGCVAG